MPCGRLEGFRLKRFLGERASSRRSHSRQVLCGYEQAITAAIATTQATTSPSFK